jgi:hypothetical protein
MSQTPLRLRPLTFLDEGEEVVIGRTDIDSYAVFPPDGAALLRELQAGRSPADAASWYRRTYGEGVDVGDFVASLRELEFVDEEDDRPSFESAEDAPAERAEGDSLRWQRLGRVAFSAPAWGAYLALVAAAVVLAVADGRYAPHQSSVFFSSSLIVIELTVLVAQTGLALVHEAFHVLAARRIGVNCRVRVSRRLYFVVFETVLDGLVVVPRRKRYLPMLAGMLADVLAIACLTLAAWLVPGIRGVCLAIAFTSLPRIAWQFYFYLRTDLYFLAVTALRCVDLDTVTRGVLRNAVNRARRRPDRVDDSGWHPRDRRVARWYAPLHVAGYALSIAMLVVVVAPLAYSFFSQAAERLGSGAGSARFWDSAFVLGLTAAQLVIAAAIALRERRQARRST